ncbi:cold-shock protein [Alphaproteobacteria bacterium]|nr:cold-shock protein [Alphaproteobacteria bacterium]
MIVDSDENKPLRVTGKIKWFNQFKGYGFVEVGGVSEDVFLHFSIMDQCGIKRLNNDDVIICDITKAGKGYQVTNVVEILHLNKYEIEDKKPEKVTVVMKWFNPAKGFGFAIMPTGEDVFVHSNLLKKHSIGNIEHGSPLTLLVRHTNFGYEAVEIFND